MIKFLPLLLICSCISIPDISPLLDLERGACVVTYPDREDICLEVTFDECFASLGKYNGDGSTCDSTIPKDSIATTEPSSWYLNKTVIYSVGGAITTIVAAIASNIAIRRRRKRGNK